MGKINRTPPKPQRHVPTNVQSNKHKPSNSASTNVAAQVSGKKISGGGNVKSVQFQAAVARVGLERNFNSTTNVSSPTRYGVRSAGVRGVRTVRGLIDTTPGDPRPPAAQGLNFSQTKGASIIAYKANKGEVYKFPGGAEWTVIDVKVNPKTGFRAIALKSNIPGDKRVVVAYADTVDKKDWITNFKQGAGLSTGQYRDAVSYAKQWKAKSGNNVILTGNSLGGGLASYASVKSGLRATAINSAPLALNHLGLNPRVVSRITQYYVRGEVLSVLNKLNPLDARPGKNIAVEGRYSILKPSSAINNHYPWNVAPEVGRPERIR